MQTVIVAICKNKIRGLSGSNKWCDVGNYRPVSLTTTISKLFEHYILSCISPFVVNTDKQLTSAYFYSDCVVLCKQGYLVFPAFLNVSKAFSKSYHDLLFAKLIRHCLPMRLVTQLMSWY